MALTKIDSYEVMYSANKFPPQIGLRNGKNIIGQLLFMPNGSTLPADTLVSGQAQLYYYMESFHNVIDLLRNEGPVYLLYAGSGDGFENGIKTLAEKAGEGEGT